MDKYQGEIKYVATNKSDEYVSRKTKDGLNFEEVADWFTSAIEYVESEVNGGYYDGHSIIVSATYDGSMIREKVIRNISF